MINLNDPTIPIIGQMHQTEDLVKTGAWCFENGFKAAVGVLEKMDLGEDSPQDTLDFYDALRSRMKYLAKNEVRKLADTAARNTVRDYLKKKKAGK